MDTTLNSFLQELLYKNSQKSLSPHITLLLAELQIAYSIEKNDPRLQQQMQYLLSLTHDPSKHSLDVTPDPLIPHEFRQYMKYLFLGKTIYDLLDTETITPSEELNTGNDNTT